jgi:AraC family transcriptional regulator of adaptative response/methylated-DNA-[protein]-cysteine methyltransferase
MKRKFDINRLLGFDSCDFSGRKPEPPTSAATRNVLLEAMHRSEEWLNSVLPHIEEMRHGLDAAYAITTLTPVQFAGIAPERPVTYGFARTAFGVWQVNSMEQEGIVSAFRFSEGRSLPPLSERTAFGNRPYRRDDAMAQEAVDTALGLRSKRLHLCFAGSPLQQRVWQALLLIPRGCVLSYEQLARLAGKPRAVRAVASCVARNEMGLIVPCQRIVRKNGNIGPYAWDPYLKIEILETELKH